MGKPYVIRVGSQSGGVGKTAVCVNLALALSMLGKKVLLIDGDYINPSVGFYLDIEDVKAGMSDLLERKKGLKDVAVKYDNTELYVVPGILSVTIKVKRSDLKQVPLRLDEAAGFDFVVIDTPTGLYDNITMRIFDDGLIVSTPTMRSMRMAFELSAIYSKAKLNKSLVLNRVTNRKGEIPVREIEDAFGARALAVLPDDPIVYESEVRQIPALKLNRNSPFSKSMLELARIYIGKSTNKG
ncbi:MAG: AAA family ATPase [Candidatus Micrarchaeota archaeon]|nr:AAA family ATPase [Candidatus Micrarchaeota archaeon]